MAKGKTCELCGLPDTSYTIEDDGNVLHVCKLCYDGYMAQNGDVDEMAENLNGEIIGGSKPETLSVEQMAQLLKRGAPKQRKQASPQQQRLNEERRKIDAAVKRAVAAKVEQTLAADTEEITRELLETKAEIEQEERRIQEEQQAQQEAAPTEEAQPAAAEAAEQPEEAQPADDASSALVTVAIDTPATPAVRTKTSAELEREREENEARVKLAEEKLLAAIHLAANPKIDDERIKITSPEVELAKDTRLKTNLDVATEGHAGTVRFIHAFKYVLHPVTYAIFAGLIAIAVFTALMITKTWKEAVIDLAACAGAVTIGALLVWYLKRRLEVDKRTVLLRIRQEQILFASMISPCYRELKTKYPMIKALAWLLGRLAVIVPVVVLIGGAAAGVITTFMVTWWYAAPVIAASAIGAVLLYYVLKFSADLVQYKLDIERNQQIAEQTQLDLLAKK